MRYIVFGFILLLPLLIYLAWAHLVSKRRRESGGTWDDAPFTRLVIIGLFLLAGALIISRFVNTGEEPTSIVPPQYEDDRFIRRPRPQDPDTIENPDPDAPGEAP